VYRLHPWFGRNVFIHKAVDKPDGAVFRCTLDGSEVARWLEIPAWMFDRATCVAGVRFSADPSVSLEALNALSALLDQVLKADAPSSNTRLRGAFGVSRDQNQGEAHGTEDDGISNRESKQGASRRTADRFVRKPVSGRHAQLARPAEGSAGSADHLDDAADLGARADHHDANNGGSRP
jgi:hypothetical protein